MTDSALVLLSGGLDSVTLLYSVSKEYSDIHAITYLYGQKNNRELESALYFADILDVKHSVINLKELQFVFGNASLIDNEGSEKIPHPNSTTTQTVLNKTIVPFRNGIFLSIATAYCISNKINTILYGAHATDYQTYLDCRPNFITAFEYAVRLGSGNHHMNIEAPFVNMTRSQIVKTASMYGVPFEHTYSCYEGEEYHCGRCPTCIERRNAFKEAGVLDVTEYYK